MQTDAQTTHNDLTTDAQAYAQAPRRFERKWQHALAEAAPKVAAYRAALAEAARIGKLSDEHGAALATKILKLAAISPSAAALISFERSLHLGRRTALEWSNGKSDRSSEVLALESLADDATRRLEADVACIGY